jgi:hypothetical protein
MYRRAAGKRSFSSSVLSIVHEYCLVSCFAHPFFFLALDASLYIPFSSTLLVYIAVLFAFTILHSLPRPG